MRPAFLARSLSPCVIDVSVLAVMLALGFNAAISVIPSVQPTFATLISTPTLPASLPESPAPTTIPEEPVAAPPSPATARGTLVLFVSDQSFRHSSAHLDVVVDGVEVVNGSFGVEEQHSWTHFTVVVLVGSVDVRELDTVVTGHFDAFMNESKSLVVNFEWYPERDYGPALSFGECPCFDGVACRPFSRGRAKRRAGTCRMGRSSSWRLPMPSPTRRGGRCGRCLHAMFSCLR